MQKIVLHYVLDEWFAQQVQPRLRGPGTLVRYCDDFVVLLGYIDDAERVLEVLGKRLGKYGLHCAGTKPVWSISGFGNPHGIRVEPRRWSRPSTSSGLPMLGHARGRARQWCASRRPKLVWRVRSRQLSSSAGPCDIGHYRNSTNASVRCSGGTLATSASPATSNALPTCMDRPGVVGTSGWHEGQTTAPLPGWRTSGCWCAFLYPGPRSSIAMPDRERIGATKNRMR